MKKNRIVIFSILTIAFILILPNWTRAEGFTETELSYYDDAISIGTGFKNIYNDSAFHIYGNEVTLLNFAVLPEDKYNNNKCNISFLPVFFTDITGAMGVLISSYNTVLSDVIGGVLALPMLLGNAKINLNLQPLIKNQKEYLTTTLYLRSRFDWFMLHSNAFCKYSPEIGLNLDYLQNRNPGTKGFSLSIGAIYPIDILEEKTFTNGFKFAISLSYVNGDGYFLR